jgi:hypothetical protein
MAIPLWIHNVLGLMNYSVPANYTIADEVLHCELSDLPQVSIDRAAIMPRALHSNSVLGRNQEAGSVLVEIMRRQLPCGCKVRFSINTVHKSVKLTFWKL